MPALEATGRHQLAVLWDKGTNAYDDYGEVQLDAATEITVQWQMGQREGLDPQGNTITLDSTLGVNQDIEPGSILWLGAIADLPSPPTNLRQVVNFNKVPDIRGREYRRTIDLIKFSDTLPELA